MVVSPKGWAPPYDDGRASVPTFLLRWSQGIFPLRGPLLATRVAWSQGIFPLRGPLLATKSGPVGFEPTNAAVKVLCLTAWLWPNILKKPLLFAKDIQSLSARVDTGIRTQDLQSHNLTR